MVVAVIAPFAGQRVIEIPARERLIGGEQVDDLHQSQDPSRPKCLRWTEDDFSLQNGADVFEGSFDVAFREAYLAKALDDAEFLAAVLEMHTRHAPLR